MRKIMIILAGGQSQRMGGIDKGEMLLGEMRLIDHTVKKSVTQADQVIISGTYDYGTGLKTIPDHKGGPKGPAAAIYATHIWLKEHNPQAHGFFTVPVDGPFVPEDLVARLSGTGVSAIAAGDDGLHPTFAYWSLVALEKAWPVLIEQESLSLRALARTCDAAHIHWSNADMFFNINTPSDLKEAATRLEPTTD
ncbi:molybdenum cofactor guanylyltransferase [Sphingorhabdus sp. Alg239-R122]|uniref:molybdenum cofactor guanylyltransferase n=1 Tax=Sphingorhabdus sp. Alg239-R122 TaxID=2305989 RepID=UPI0013DA38E8|nr:molybdenum cofactor guanylyltransferase [Sphingorhabdus sp. Alg239-R122]